MLNMCSFPKAIVKKRHLLRNPSPFKKNWKEKHNDKWREQ